VNLPLLGLLHDAHEAYVGDVATPQKRLLGELWERHELRVADAVRDRFALPCRPDELEIITAADKIALAMEARDLLPGGPIGWAQQLPEPLPWTIVPVSPIAARERFIHRFWQLTRSGELN
jgi:5'-deoxynucleotidase YfbR-like HD superfamily hydrolase